MTGTDGELSEALHDLERRAAKLTQRAGPLANADMMTQAKQAPALVAESVEILAEAVERMREVAEAVEGVNDA